MEKIEALDGIEMTSEKDSRMARFEFVVSDIVGPSVVSNSSSITIPSSGYTSSHWLSHTPKIANCNWGLPFSCWGPFAPRSFANALSLLLKGKPSPTGSMRITVIDHCQCHKADRFWSSSDFSQMDTQQASSAKLDQLKGSGWVVMYPSYIDKSMSAKDGRKVTMEYACTLPSRIHSN